MWGLNGVPAKLLFWRWALGVEEHYKAEDFSPCGDVAVFVHQENLPLWMASREHPCAALVFEFVWQVQNLIAVKTVSLFI